MSAMMDALLLKAAAKGREVQERRESERRKALLVLMLRHMLDQGYIEAAAQLSRDSNVSMSKWDAADNCSLLQILQDYEEEQEQRYGRRPKLVKQLYCGTEVSAAVGGALSHQVSRQPSQHQHVQGVLTPPLCPAAPVSGQLAAHQRREKAAAAAAQAASQTPPAVAAGKPPAPSRSLSQGSKGSQHSCSTKQELAPDSTGGSSTSSSSNDSSRTQSAAGSSRPALEVCGQGCEASTSTGPKQRSSQGGSSCDTACGSDEEGDAWAARLLKPLPSTLLGELRQLGAAISQEIYLESPNVKWSDIAGLADAKRLLQEAVGLPMRYPQLFTGLLAPWRGVLLYGPPGTGKTLLAKAVATSCRTTFFNISASSIVSKWRGDSEKLVRVLFDLARHHAPATIFLDEVDALMGARGAEGEHEASRRMKTELLIQMDGLTRSSGSSSSSSSAGPSEPQVFVLAASNLPWHLDPALLRRLQKRILVPLPDAAARRSMLQGLLTGRLAAGVALDGLVEATEGYSGSDITLLAKEAAMRPLRRLLAVLEPGVYAGSDAVTPGSDSGAAAHAEHTVPVQGSSSIEAGHQVELGPVTAADLVGALAVTKPSAGGYEQQYAEFTSRVGQAG